MTNTNVYFRAGVGMILYRGDQVVFFERADEPGHWQFPQGGLYPGDSPEDTMWRELGEETGLSEDDVASVHRVPFLASYAYPRQMTDSFQHTGADYIGQTQFWFILHLKDEVRIDLSKASDKEFTDHKWIDPDQALQEIIEWKRGPYEQLIDYFHQYIKTL